MELGCSNYFVLVGVFTLNLWFTSFVPRSMRFVVLVHKDSILVALYVILGACLGKGGGGGFVNSFAFGLCLFQSEIGYIGKLIVSIRRLG